MVIWETYQLSDRAEEGVAVGEAVRTAKGVKVPLGKGPAPLRRLPLASLESLAE